MSKKDAVKDLEKQTGQEVKLDKTPIIGEKEDKIKKAQEILKKPLEEIQKLGVAIAPQITPVEGGVHIPEGVYQVTVGLTETSEKNDTK